MSPRELLSEHRDAVDPVPSTVITTRCHVCRRVVGVVGGRLELHARTVELGNRMVQALCPGSAEVSRG